MGLFDYIKEKKEAFELKREARAKVKREEELLELERIRAKRLDYQKQYETRESIAKEKALLEKYKPKSSIQKLKEGIDSLNIKREAKKEARPKKDTNPWRQGRF